MQRAGFLLVSALLVCYGTSASVRTATETYKYVGDRLWNIYAYGGLLGTSSVTSVSKALEFNKFGGVDPYSEAYFRSKPVVALAGQFSTGKTTMLQDLILNTTYPSSHIDPAPSTDKFTFITDGGARASLANAAREESGRAVASRKGSALEAFAALGDGFLQTLKLVKVSHEDAPILRRLSLLDTPGVLSAGAEHAQRYDMVQAWQLIAAHADMVIVMFDIKAGDISDRFNKVLQHFAAVEDKVMFLFNKADTLTPAQLLSAYGSTMWHLGRVFMQPEAERITFGSFHTQPCNVAVAGEDGCKLFEQSKVALVDKLQQLELEAPLLRIGQFELFLARLEVMMELRLYLQANTKNFGWSFGFHCENVDGQGRRMDAPFGLHHHLREAIRTKALRQPVLPDIDRFVDAVLRVGGMCGVPAVDSSHMDILETAREKVRALYDALGREKPSSRWQAWGFAKPKETATGHAFAPADAPAEEL